MAAAVEEDWETAVSSLSIDTPKEDPVGGKCASSKTVNSNGDSLTDRISIVSLDANGGSTATAASETKGARPSAVFIAKKADSAKSPAVQDGPIDPSLLDALENARDYVLKLEDELVAFVTGQERKPHLVLPPRSSYQRLIAYRLCARFKLQKATASQEREALMANGFPPTVGTASAPKNIMGNGGISPQPGKEQRATVFIRSTDSAVPVVLLTTLHAEAQKKEATAAAAAAVLAATATAVSSNKGAPIKLMRRSPCDIRAKSLQQGQGGSGLEKQVKTVEDREREYAEARARIFGTRSPNGPPTPPQSSSDSSVSASTAAGSAAAPPGEMCIDSPRGATHTAATATGTPAAGERTAEAGSPIGVTSAKSDSVANNKSAPSTPAPTSGSIGTTPNITKVPVVTGGAEEEQGGSGTAVGSGAEDSKSSASIGASTTPVRRMDREGGSKQAGGATTSQGPDGTPGFSRGRGKPLSGKEEGERVVAGGARLHNSEGADKGNGSAGNGRTGGQGDRGSSSNGPGGRGNGGRGNRRPAVNAGEWKGQRGMQRNRAAEMSDPDFVRNYENYRPSFAPYRYLADPSGVGMGHGQPPGRFLQHQSVSAGGTAHPQFPGMPGKSGHLRGQIPGQGPQGMMVMQPQWQQHMEAQAMAAAAAAAATGNAGYPGGPPTPGLYNQGFMDPAQAAAAGAAGMCIPAAGVRAPGIPGATMHHQHMQQQAPQQGAHQQGPQQQPQQHTSPQCPQHGHPHTQQMGFMPQQQQGQQQQLQTGMLHQQHIPGGMNQSSGYMMAQDYYGVQQQAMYYQDPSMAGMAMGYGAQQQQQQQQPYGMSIPQHAQQQPQQQQHRHQPGQQSHNPYQHQVYSAGTMQQQQQPIPQQHRRLQGNAGNGGSGRHPNRPGNVPLMSMHSQQGTPGGRTVPNRAYQTDFPPLG